MAVGRTKERRRGKENFHSSVPCGHRFPEETFRNIPSGSSGLFSCTTPLNESWANEDKPLKLSLSESQHRADGNESQSCWAREYVSFVESRHFSFSFLSLHASLLPLLSVCDAVFYIFSFFCFSLCCCCLRVGPYVHRLRFKLAWICMEHND